MWLRDHGSHSKELDLILKSNNLKVTYLRSLGVLLQKFLKPTSPVVVKVMKKGKVQETAKRQKMYSTSEIQTAWVGATMPGT